MNKNESMLGNKTATCEVCGNVYDKCFEVKMGGKTHVFDSFECAIHALAPTCAHCGCRKDIMTKEVQVIHPNDSLQTAAQKMSSHDIGFLPVLEADQLVGVITDRDLVLRGIAQGMNSNAMLGRELMTSPVIYCFEDQDIKEVAKLMEESQIRRLVILSRSDKRLVGVVSLGDLALNSKSDTSAEVLQKVSEPIG